MSEESMTMQPVEAHEKINPFVGTFRAVVKFWMEGQCFESTGTMVNHWILGGRYLAQDYQGDQQDGPFPEFQGRGYWGFNTMTNQYEGLWIDNASTMMQMEKGDVDGDGKVWTMMGEMESPQGKTQKESIITLISDDEHKMEMFFLFPGKEKVKTMEIHYTRSK